MKEIERDEEREHRIEMEVIVDAYGPEEQALGLKDKAGLRLARRMEVDLHISAVRVYNRLRVEGFDDTRAN